jgi:hypothetical protein
VIDLLFVAILLAFFALAVLFVRACDRIIGSDEAAADLIAGGTDREKLAA